MPYSKQTWHDLPAQDTPISAARLGHIEDGIYQAANVYNVLSYGAVSGQDSTTAFQEAIDDIAVAPGILFVPPGDYIISTLIPCDNLTIRGAGPMSILTHKVGTTDPLIFYSQFQANPLQNVTIEQLRFVGQGGTENNKAAVWIVKGRDTRVRNNEVYNFASSAFILYDCHRTWVTDNYCDTVGTASGRNVINVAQSPAFTPGDEFGEAVVDGNVVTNTPSFGIGVIALVDTTATQHHRVRVVNNYVSNAQEGIVCELGTAAGRDVIIANNQVEACSLVGIGVIQTGANLTTADQAENVLVVNNQVDSRTTTCTNGGILLNASRTICANNIVRSKGTGIAGGGTAARPNEHTRIANNIITITANAIGINFGVNSREVDIVGNTIEQLASATPTNDMLYLNSIDGLRVKQNTLIGAGRFGVQVLGGDAAKRTEITGNTIIDPNESSNAVGAGIYLVYGVNDPIVDHNTIRDTRGSPRMIYGVYRAGSGRPYARGNTIRGYTSSPFGASSAPDTWPFVWNGDHGDATTPITVVNQYKRYGYGSAAPSAGTWAVGDFIQNTGPAAGGTFGWVCTTAGTPGTWKALGGIAA